MMTAIKRNGKWERTDWLDRLCWRLGPAFIRLNRRLDFFRDRWFPRAEAPDFALKAKPGEDGAAKPAEKTQREVAPTVRVLVEGANAFAGDALEDEREARTAVDGFGLDALDEAKRVKLGGDNGVLPAERDGDGGAQPRQ